MARPTKRTDAIINRVLEGLSKGTPLAVICREPGMVSHDAVNDWANGDDDLRRSIARAREVGFDAIAEECLTIADNKEEEPASRRVRVETRLKLLAKWDPKRYGEMMKLAGPSGEELQSKNFNITLDMTGAQAAEAYAKMIGAK